MLWFSDGGMELVEARASTLYTCTTQTSPPCILNALRKCRNMHHNMHRNMYRTMHRNIHATCIPLCIAPCIATCIAPYTAPCTATYMQHASRYASRHASQHACNMHRDAIPECDVYVAYRTCAVNAPHQRAVERYRGTRLYIGIADGMSDGLGVGVASTRNDRTRREISNCAVAHGQ